MSVPPDPPNGRGFIIGAFVVAAVIGVVIAYLGITGYLGAGIP